MAHAIRLSATLVPRAPEAVAAFRAAPDPWLPTPLRRNGVGHWQLYLWAGEIGVLVDCGVGAARWQGANWRRPVTWRPLRGDTDSLLSRAVPSFCGALEIAQRGDDDVELILAGTYRPPGGAAGSLVDRLALHRLARRTAKTFAATVAERLNEVARASVGVVQS